jgi:hypothetical protein
VLSHLSMDSAFDGTVHRGSYDAATLLEALAQ